MEKITLVVKSSSNISVLKIEEFLDRIIFKGNYFWKNFLNADRVEINSYNFSLPFNKFSVNKVGKIFPDCWKDFSFHIFPKKEFEEKTLRNYQQEDVQFLSKINSVAIFNEMRTGKTPTSLCLCKKWLVSRIIIICPSILQTQWQSSIESWLNIPAYLVSYLPLKERELVYKKFFVQHGLSIVISKDLFKRDYEIFNKIRFSSFNSNDFCVIVDESHFLRNYGSQQSKSIYSLSNSKYKIVLTGTPFVNNYSDVFGILKFLYPFQYKSYWKFVNSYFKIKESEIKKGNKRIFIRSVSGFKDWNSRNHFVKEISTFSVRRKQIDILPWLPKVIRQKELLIMGEKQQKIYDDWSSKKKGYSEKLFNLKSVTMYPSHLNPESKIFGVKIEYLVSFCSENFGKQVIIFSTRSETFLFPLSKELSGKNINYSMITGKTPHKDRDEIVERFQNSDIKIILCNIQSAGYGLELSSADTIIFADRSYSPADNEQAEARFLPTKESGGNSRIKMIIDLVCKGTIDEKIAKLLDKKKDIISIINQQPHLLFEN